MRLTLLACALLTPATQAQWQLQQSNTSASLRGIHALGSGIAWASGTEGTILRTTDQGQHWQRCTTPPAAEHLDFRGIQAFDAQTAIVMSSGKGDLSRLYKTTDACQTWKLVFTNPDQEGFWDAIQFTSSRHGFLLGDPVTRQGEQSAHVFLEETSDGGLTWTDWHDRPSALSVTEKTAIFAASNSSMVVDTDEVWVGTGGDPKPGLLKVTRHLEGVCNCYPMPTKSELDAVHADFLSQSMTSGPTAGIFAIGRNKFDFMLVGGDYTKPDGTSQNVLFLRNGYNAVAATTPPHGYRSSVAYSPTHHAWITVGPNGTDLSTDDGRNWHPLKPGPNDASDADRKWNALSLPFVVGPHGRIGLLKPTAFPQP